MRDQERSFPAQPGPMADCVAACPAGAGRKMARGHVAPDDGAGLRRDVRFSQQARHSAVARRLIRRTITEEFLGELTIRSAGADT
jgi:hypothetical protein